MSNYLPKRPESEDDESIRLHTNWLKQEHKKTEQDFRLVDLKMDLTFADRRYAVVKQNKALQELVMEYPFMKDRRQLLLEFTRLGPNTEKKDLEDLIFDGLDRYKDAIISLSNTRKMQDFQRYVYDQVKVQRSEEQRKYTSQCAAILGIAILLKEKFEKILCFGQPKETDESFQIVVRDNILTMDTDAFTLKIDNTNIFSCETFLELIAGLIASIYSFNLVYPKAIEKSLMLIQNCLMGFNDGGRVDKKIISVITELNRERAKVF